MRPSLPLPLPFSLLTTTINLLIIAVIVIVILALFKSNLYNRLSTRITMLILASGLIMLIIALAFNAITSDTLSPPWLRQLQIMLAVIGGPVIIGLLAARFVRRPLRQFNKAVASMEQNNYKVQLKPTGIHEFDEVFAKFNNLTQRLRNEEKLRKDLVSDTSHELNTPLTAMIGQLTAMQEGKHPLTKERVILLKEQAERLAELVRQLDAYTKARALDFGESEDIPLKEFCRQLVDQFDVDMKRKNIHTRLSIADDLILHANRDALQKILTNLIQNTLHYSKASELVITATTHELTFSDNGKGVPAKSLPFLFERFYRVDPSRNRTTGGLGLGLAIVRELAEGQGWHIHAKNNRPGLTFNLTFTKSTSDKK